MDSSYFSASDGHLWVKMESSSLVALEANFIWGVEVPVLVPGLATASYGTSLLLHLVLLPMVMLLLFFIIMLRLMPYHS